MTTNDTDALTLADLDRLLPPEYDIVQAGDPRNEHHHALRAVRHNTGGQTHYFSSLRDYFAFAVSVAPRQRLLSEAYGIRYVQLSASYDDDPYFPASLTTTVAALTRSNIIVHRMKSDVTSVRFVLTQEEMAVLIEAYQAFLADSEESVAENAGVHPCQSDVL